jgi:hypothetical protein
MMKNLLKNKKYKLKRQMDWLKRQMYWLKRIRLKNPLKMNQYLMMKE